MKRELVININLDNAAFEEPNEAAEIARILAGLAAKYARGDIVFHTKLYDVNGNNVGAANVEEYT